MSFAACLPIILQSEGGFVIDQGGPTNCGITIPALQSYLRKPCAEADIRALTPTSPVVADLYETNYYNAAHCNELPAGVDLMVFDEAVNEGVGRAIEHLQEALGIPADGYFGPMTRAAVKTKNATYLIIRLHDTNAAYYRSLDEVYPQDEGGWQARNDRTYFLARKMAIGT